MSEEKAESIAKACTFDTMRKEMTKGENMSAKIQAANMRKGEHFWYVQVRNQIYLSIHKNLNKMCNCLFVSFLTQKNLLMVLAIQIQEITNMYWAFQNRAWLNTSVKKSELTESLGP